MDENVMVPTVFGERSWRTRLKGQSIFGLKLGGQNVTGQSVSGLNLCEQKRAWTKSN